MPVSEFFVLREMESGETVELAGVAFMIGREAVCDIRIDNPRVSRRHARLQISRGELVIEDLESANGTRINGKQIRAPERLGSGDVVTIGGVSFLVLAPDTQTGMTVIGDRLPERPDSFVAEDTGDDAETWVSQAYGLPAGWSDDQFGRDQFNRDAAEQRLSKQLLTKRIATDRLAAVLFVVDGAAVDTLFQLPTTAEAQWLLGRGPNCDPRIDDATVSRHHANLRHGEQGWHIEDLGTTNGCMINGKRVDSQAQLQRGDLLSLGNVTFLFRPFC